MKRHIISCMACVILLAFSNIAVSSSAKTYIPLTYDSIHISLLTCSSHPEVYSLYGHTAIRYENTAARQDYVINYGVFDFSDRWFVPRFTFGITDYSMGVLPYYFFEDEYRRCGSSITQQEINLTPEEKRAVSEALAENFRPENRVYRYNYFYKNCSTMARDIIVGNINGQVIYPESNVKKSFREMIHECNEGYPWARLGNDMLLGMRADFNTTTEERQFLPLNLMNDFEKAVIVNNGDKRPLVKSTTVILQPGTQTEMEGFPMTPLMCSLVILFICMSVLLFEGRKKAITLWFDAVMMVLTGVAGILVLIMFFSQHPTTSTNLLVLMLNPMPLFFIRNVYKASKNGRVCVWWKMWAVMSILTLLAAAVIQDIDVSMLVIAAVLLLRSLQHVHYERKMKLEK